MPQRLAKLRAPFPVFDRQNAGNNRFVYTGLFTCVAKPKKRLGLKEKLGQGLVCPCIQLGLEPVDVGAGVLVLRGECRGRLRHEC